jgi:UPF0716 protein FxsA
MAAILFIALVTVPIVEIAIFLEVGGIIGFWPTMGVVVLTAFIGTGLLRQQGLATLAKVQASLEQNRLPMEEVFDGLCLLVAGALLLTPGFFTDAVGFLLFVPAFRRVLRFNLARFMAARGHIDIHASGFPRHPGTGPGTETGAETGAERGVGTIIDGEYTDLSPETEEPDPDEQSRWKGNSQGSTPSRFADD